MKRWIACQSYFIVLSVCTRDLRNHDRFEWLLNCILSFSQSIHATYETMTDLISFSIIFYRSHSPYTRCTKPWQTTTCVGLAQARPNNKDQHDWKWFHPCSLNAFFTAYQYWLLIYHWITNGLFSLYNKLLRLHSHKQYRHSAPLSLVYLYITQRYVYLWMIIIII